MQLVSYLYEKCCGNPEPVLELLVPGDEEQAMPDGAGSQSEVVTPSPVCAPCRPIPKWVYSILIPGVSAQLIFTTAYLALIRSVYDPSSSEESSSSMTSSSSSSSDSDAEIYSADSAALLMMSGALLGSLTSFAGGAILGNKAYENREAIFDSASNAMRSVKNTVTSLRDRLCQNPERTRLIPISTPQIN